ncbi:MAG TPA: carbamoyltransferase HypF [Polyangiaceae bacterium]|nr:carbamoyltransferase HypF [Polyangiaceae bacterium]
MSSTSKSPDRSTNQRVRLQIRGRVQGVGFRPLVYRLATELELSGWVRNGNRGVTIELEGATETLHQFELRLRSDVRAPARIEELRTEPIPPEGADQFLILASDDSGTKDTTLLADIAPCEACRRDFTAPGNRRYRYPFTNCTHCGPRFTIIRGVPYDRPKTTMAGFVQCPECQREYDDPRDRRFHAQPNACPVCGPTLAWIDPGSTPAQQLVADDALAACARAIRDGKIVALQGIGGFQLLVDARNEEAVLRLRRRKHRWEKPLGLMVRDLAQARELTEVGAEEAALLISPEAPIVLLRRKHNASLASSLAPANPYLGLMLPSSPLHHLLMAELGFPIVATSGNLSEEPICIAPKEATERLASIADHWLVHDRPIERHADDSVAAVVGGEVQLLRRARGYAPLPVPLPSSGPTVLAVGGHMKNTIALAIGDRCFVSQHIGDLESAETRATCLRVIADFLRIYAVKPEIVAHDLHPDHASTQIAEELTASGGLLEHTPRCAVQHHHAHLAACLADVGSNEQVLGVTWDGSGLGTDRTLWGGEFLFGNAQQFERIACLQPFLLPGGDRSARSPRRIAVALLYQLLGKDALAQTDLEVVRASSDQELALLRSQIDKRVLTPYTSSIGRLFDAVASLLGLCHESAFEGQAAMALEFAADQTESATYPLSLVERTLLSNGCARELDQPSRMTSPTLGLFPLDSPRFHLDPTSLIEAILADLARGIEPGKISARFHGWLVQAVVEVAARVNVGTVALSGGCFQNRLLLERCKAALNRQGHRVLVHHQVPPNDGSLALGQVAVAMSQL